MKLERGIYPSWAKRGYLNHPRTREIIQTAAAQKNAPGSTGQKVGEVKLPNAQQVLDAAIQMHGALGVTLDTPLTQLLAYVRTIRLADGPDEVHRKVIARHEWARQREARACNNSVDRGDDGHAAAANRRDRPGEGADPGAEHERARPPRVEVRSPHAAAPSSPIMRPMKTSSFAVSVVIAMSP